MKNKMFDANYQDLKVGDRIVIIYNEDQDLDDWYNDAEYVDDEYDRNGERILTISNIEEESELLWVEGDCPYAIQMACVLKMDDEN